MKKEAQGLSEQDAQARLEKYGYNEIPDREKKNIAKVILGIITEPMIFLLLAAVTIYFVLGDTNEAIVLGISVIVVVALELYQDMKTEKALAALRELSSPSCTVIRDGTHKTIASRELVVGDILVVSEGGRVAADCRLVEASNVVADESLLTGESIPVDKTDDGANKNSILYSGTMVVKGHGLAEVTATGVSTEIGKIGTSLNTIKSEKTQLQKEINKIVKVIAIFAISACVLLAMLFWLLRGDLLQGFLAGLTLAISTLPEEFPVVLTVFMAFGAWRLAKNNVLTRKNRTIETLGSATVLCTDKTGTLTENRMQIQEVTNARAVNLSVEDAEYAKVISYGVLASQKNPFDPMEEAFIDKAGEISDIARLYGDDVIMREYPLEPGDLSVVHVWGNNNSAQFAAVKGAPEAVFTLCRLDDKDKTILSKKVTEMAQSGLRVLGVGRADLANEKSTMLPEKRDEYNFEFLGLVALADPIRPEAAPAVALCREAGVRVIMVTGDYAETARHIGQKIGLDSKRVVTGDEFRAMSRNEQSEAVKNVSIFSRVRPEDKLVIVDALKNAGEVVAMTGDGVNDAPALKASHIGIAMGQRGTDVAREAAAIVLLDDNFASIVKGVRLGRRIFTNLQKAIAYLLIVHLPIIALSLLPVLFGWPLVLMPIHIVFLEFIIDPSCTLIFEAESEEPGIMKRSPRKLNAPMFNKAMVLHSVTVGLLVSGVIVASYGIMLAMGWSEEKARSLTYLMVIMANLFIILAISGGRAVRESYFSGNLKNPMFVLTIVFMGLLLVIYSLPPALELFKFAPISFVEALTGVGFMLAVALASIPLRRLFRRPNES